MTTQNIFRSSYTTNYTVFGNELTQNSQLSPRAYRILTYLLSLPSEWKLRVKHLMRHFGFGRDSTYKALLELRKLGYVILKRSRRSSSWLVYDQPQTDNSDTSPHVEIVSETTTEAASKNPDFKNPTFQDDIKSTNTSFKKNKENNNTSDPLYEQKEPVAPIVVVNSEEEKTVDPIIVVEVEKLAVQQIIKPTLIKTLATLTLIEAKAVLMILARAIPLGKVQNPVGYTIELSKRAKNGTLNPVTTNEPLTLSERLAQQEKRRKEDAERGKMDNQQWMAWIKTQYGINVQI